MAERVYCLYRVSTNKQVDHDENNQADIPMQRKACHDFAAKMGWVIVGEEQETGVSGYKVSADDRDKLQLIKKYAEQGKFDTSRRKGSLLKRSSFTVKRCCSYMPPLGITVQPSRTLPLSSVISFLVRTRLPVSSYTALTSE